MFAFDWKNDPDYTWSSCWNPVPGSSTTVEYGPDKVACEFLDDLGAQIRANKFNGKTPVKAIREAVGSGHGIGKSALAAMGRQFIMSTRPFSHGTVTANTSEQLFHAKTWRKWRSGIRGASRALVRSNDRQGRDEDDAQGAPENGSAPRRPVARRIAKPFAGQHAPRPRASICSTRAGAYRTFIDEVSEGGLTDGER